MVPGVEELPGSAVASPRAAPGGSRTSSSGSTGPSRCTGVDAAGLRRQAPERGVPRALPDLLHQRPRRHPAATTASASTTSPGRPTTRTATRCGPERPRSSGDVLRERRPGNRHQQDDPRERHALVLIRPLLPHPREEATVGALRRAAAGHDVSVRALSHHQKRDRVTNALAEATRSNV